MNLDSILNILIKYDLSADELLLIYLTFLAQDEENHPEYFKKWFTNGGQQKLRTLFESLKTKGVISKNYNPTQYNPNDIEFNKNFIKQWIKNSYQLGEELFNEYEQFLNINGKYVPLRNISKKFYSLEDFYFHYSKTIGHSIEKHKEIINLLKYAKEKKLITYGILEFVASKKWEDIKYMKDNGIESMISDTLNLYTD